LVLVVGLVIVLLALAYAVVASRPTTTAVPVRIAHLKLSSALAFYVAIDKGFFEKRGLQVEMIPVESSTQGIEAVIAGRADASTPVSVPSSLAAWQTEPGIFRVIGLVEFTEAELRDCILVKKDSPITSFEQLAGKKVGGLPSAQLAMVIQVIAEQHGMPANSVQYVGLAQSLQLEALQAGTIDALHGVAAICTSGLQLGIGRIILSNPQLQVINPMPSLFAIVSSAFDKAQPRAAKALEDALSEAVEFIKKDPGECKRILSQYAGGTYEMTDVYTWLGYRRTNEINVKNLQDYVGILVQRGLLTKPVDVAAMLRR